VKRKRFSVEQIVAVLKQAELGVPVAELIRQVGITEQTKTLVLRGFPVSVLVTSRRFWSQLCPRLCPSVILHLDRPPDSVHLLVASLNSAP
jgi:hypothetical protein